jgi:hypothetical protein
VARLRCDQRVARSSVDGGGCNNGAVSLPRRPRADADGPSVPAADASRGATAPAAGGMTRPGRLTKQVVFLMLIGWLVLVILVVVLISVT